MIIGTFTKIRSQIASVFSVMMVETGHKMPNRMMEQSIHCEFSL